MVSQGWPFLLLLLFVDVPDVVEFVLLLGVFEFGEVVFGEVEFGTVDGVPGFVSFPGVVDVPGV